jgi:ABC-2 type transport system permease protein
MSLASRAYAQFYKNILFLKGEPFRYIDVFFWPLIAVFSVTLLLDFLESDATVFSIVIAGVAGWRLMYIVTVDIVNTFAVEHWTKSTAYLFSTPVTPYDFVLGGTASGILKGIFVSCLIAGVSALFYTFPLPSAGNVFWGAIILVLFGIALGTLILSVMYFIGGSAFASAFALPDLFSLLCGAYYPVTVLPAFLQGVAHYIPATHGFALLRADWQPMNADPLFIAGITLAWLLAAFAIHNTAFSYAKKNGLVAKLG